MASKKIFIGTSGWTYKDWDGKFYPKEIKGPERLVFYTSKFKTVEVNSTFYRLPFKGMIIGWNKRLPNDFHFVVKGSRRITHLKKLSGVKEELKTFLERVLGIKTLKVILWQLPPSLHKDLKRLEEFLNMLPRDIKHAVEFRHKSWWDADTAELLKKYNASFVAISHPRLPNDIIPTADFLYIRFHGMGPKLYDYDYSEKELKDWAKRIKRYLRGRILYAFFNNDWHANAPKNALSFINLF